MDGEAELLGRLRAICLELPDTVEASIFEHPIFRAGKKAFCILHGQAGQPAISFKVEKENQPLFLEDPRFYKTPHVGHHGWISLKAVEEPDWEEVAELILGSYRLAAGKKMLAKLPKQRG